MTDDPMNDFFIKPNGHDKSEPPGLQQVREWHDKINLVLTAAAQGLFPRTHEMGDLEYMALVNVRNAFCVVLGHGGKETTAVLAEVVQLADGLEGVVTKHHH